MVYMTPDSPGETQSLSEISHMPLARATSKYKDKEKCKVKKYRKHLPGSVNLKKSGLYQVKQTLGHKA